MIEAVVIGTATGLLFVVMAGIRRLPWRYAAIVGLGFGLVFAAGRLATAGVDPELARLLDPGVLVLIGALGGGIGSTGFERGERERQRRSAAILGSGIGAPLA